MVDINPVNKNTVVNVNSSGSVSEIKTTTPQHYYDGLAKQWAINVDKVQGLDYSSKYYAEKSKESAQNAQAYAEQVNNVKNEAITEITTTKNETIDRLFNISNTSKEEISQAEQTAITNIESSKNDVIDELVQNKSNAIGEIEQTSSDGIEELNKIKVETKAFKDELVESGMYKFNLFDTKISDHILEGNEAKGWALQGTYVTKDLYPDFYSKCLEQKNNAIESQITLGSSTLTMFVNTNGHQFYNIVDKSIVDTFYNSNGIADFYGIDEENERVFLPRNKWFAIKNPPSTVPVYGNGMALGIYDGTNAFGLGAHVVVNGQPSVLTPYAKNYGTAVGSTRGDYTTTTRNDDVSWGVTNDPSKSGLIAKTSNVIQANENKYLYYCVGNTVVNDAQIDVGGLVSQMELKANATLDNILPQGKSLASFWAMPSNKIVNLTLGASGTSYIAPANGWFYLTNDAGGGNSLTLKNQTVGFWVSVPNGAPGQAPSIIIPAKKGDRVAAIYVQPSGSTTKISFIYAEGDK